MTKYLDWRQQGVDYGHLVAANEIQISASGPLEIEMVDPIALPDGRTLCLPVPNATAMLLHASKRAYDDAQKLLSKEMYKIDPRDVARMHSNAEIWSMKSCFRSNSVRT